MNEDRATRYQRLRRQASVGGALIAGGALAVLVVSGGAASLRDWSRSVAGESETLTALLVVLIVGGAVEALLLPLAYFEGVTLERRYGLFVQSHWHWWSDWAKLSALRLAAVAVAGLSVWFLLQWTPESWWVFAAAGATAVVVLLTQLAPVLLLPLFDACEPLDREALVARLMALTARANTRVLGVFEWHLGARTKKANAALTGLGRTRRILVSDTLLAEHSDDEVEVILAHELAHHVYHDIWTSIAVQAFLITVAAYTADLVLGRWAQSFGLRGRGDVAVLPMLALASGTVLWILMPLANAVSRAHERRADRYALEMTRNVSAFISAMRKIGAQNLSDDRPSALVQAFFYTHPPVSARISAARAWAAAER